MASGAKAVPPYVATPGTWHQLSYPADITGRTIGELFGASLPTGEYGTSWQLFTFDAATGAYRDPGVRGLLENGQGFWFIQDTGADVELGSADVPYAVGTRSRACTVPEGCAEVVLEGPASGPGWNLSGHPFEGPVDVDMLRLATRATGSSCSGDGCAIDESDADEVVGVPLWSFDAASGTYADLAADRIEPWQGIWVQLAPGAASQRVRVLYPDPYCS